MFMKKLLLPIFAVLVCALTSLAQTTITFSDYLKVESGTALQLDGTTQKINDSFHFVFNANGGSSKPIYYASGDVKEIRTYAKNQVTVRSGVPMTKIVFNITAQGKKRLTAITASAGTIATQAKGDETVTWTGSATDVTFTVGTTSEYGSETGKSGQLVFGSVEITGGGGTVAPVEPVEVENIKAFIDLADTQNAVIVKGDVTAVGQYGNALYVKDATGWLQIYGATGQTYKNGDVIPGGFSGKFTLYGNDVPEMQAPLEGFQAAKSTVAPVEPSVVIVADVDAEPINSYVEVRGAKISAVNGKNATLSDASGELPIYNNNGVTLTEGDNLTVRGFVASFRGKYQLTPSEVLSSSGREIVATPTFTPAAGEVMEGTSVEIKCSTEGATIYYTLDGKNPTADSEVYSKAIEITSDVTIKALAVKDGMDDSEIAVAAYTVKVVSPNEATFDFANPSTLTPAYTEGTEVDQANKYINTDEVIFTAKGISLNAKGGFNDGKPATSGRLYFQSGGAVQLRIYNYGSLTIKAPANNKITKIDFAFNNTNGANLNGGDNKVTVDGKAGTFTPAAAAEEVVFNAKGSVQINQVTVTCEKELSGVENIVAGQEDANAPVEYYNLNGVRVNNPSSGLYIVRQGTKVSKVVIR